MIYEVTGDILLSSAKTIAHGVAPNDHFATGLALSLREQWPAMVKDFRHYSHTQHPKPGGIWAWMGADGRQIVSLLTQDGEVGHGTTPGAARLEYVNHALREFRLFLEKENSPSAALPKLCTTAGRLAWNDVYPLIQQHLGDLKTPIFVYTTYRSGVQAEENPQPARARG